MEKKKYFSSFGVYRSCQKVNGKPRGVRELNQQVRKGSKRRNEDLWAYVLIKLHGCSPLGFPQWLWFG